MKKLLLLFLALLTSATRGLPYTEADPKVFTPYSYYYDTEAKNNAPDYRSMYQKRKVFYLSNGEEKSDKSVPKNDPKYQMVLFTGKAFDAWLWELRASDTDENGQYPENKKGFLKPYSESNKDGYINNVPGLGEYTYLWSVSKGTRIVSPLLSSIDMTFPLSDRPYGEEHLFTGGTALRLVSIQGDVAYRTTYYSLERYWVDMKKTKPDALADSDSSKPIYIPTVKFEKTDTVPPGQVIGLAGITGAPSNNHVDVPNGEAYVIVKFESCEVINGEPSSNWTTLQLQDVYPVD